jgi:transposase
MSSRTLSLDLREPVVAAVSNGLSRRQAAERFAVSPASAVRQCALATTTGSPAASPRGGVVCLTGLRRRQSAFMR